MPTNGAAARTALIAPLPAPAGCEPVPGPADTRAQAAADPATPAACPDADFATFLERFERSADRQRASTADPLIKAPIDADATPEPGPATAQLPLAAVPFPVMPDARRRRNEGRERIVPEATTGLPEVAARVPDSGMQTRHTFRASPCRKPVGVDEVASRPPMRTRPAARTGPRCASHPAPAHILPFRGPRGARAT